ncbi:MAG: FeoB-associated Cys-rich membrane protein [Proteobacteria bacterium]|nr:FeoB-associated Cys-rich membrane protein [Pseudomonadota bacterium]MBU1647978.1 FeoB-associated Cys-rich membrane protein [Pseudomonadota bacterium]
MWQSLSVALILILCLFFIGRKLYRQFKIATDPKEKMSCGCGCSGCSSQGCAPSQKEKR